ncbi:hypothetical protein VA596_41690 [Amycolatopsis sp., V23-08]|uniref:HK97 gp10 family phage protein n=1 Tax=Amycolatopsis heterodermiae TaxID=3110235 RepID=A0ABU5RKP6_9PSEU|nr:hypothetical protein [Amycolatopsis sp., V23-08]MEA5366100.1 hypothetical protein [Amycolatopsis sp., V23-08]
MTTVTLTGPMFTGASAAVVDQFLEDAKYAVAGAALAAVHEILDARIRHPTPYYETQLHVVQENGAQVVNDRGVVYGPWLEGTGSRNSRTRFKGYAAFRRGCQQTEGRVEDITRPLVARLVQELT